MSTLENNHSTLYCVLLGKWNFLPAFFSYNFIELSPENFSEGNVVYSSKITHGTDSNITYVSPWLDHDITGSLMQCL